jgi:NAD(P)H-hydrate epimerase
MRECDRIAINKLGIPGIVLMENAGARAAAIIEKRFSPLRGKSVTVFCGKGNNGGDGLVISRHLLNRGAVVNLFLIGGKRDLKGDPRVHFETLVRFQKALKIKSMLRIQEVGSARGLGVLPRADLVVDAIFGTGFSGPVKGLARDVISRINEYKGTVISIDMPSGLGADDGKVENAAVRADLTITMSLRKIGLYSGNGRSYAGSVEVVDIGYEPQQFKFLRPSTFLVEAADVSGELPVRPFNAHKHSVGKILIIAGSKGLTGAAFMTASAAMRSGAGAVLLVTPSSVYPILARKLTEVMVEPLPETSEGTLSPASFPVIAKHAKWADVVIIGPGLSRHEETQRLIRAIVAKVEAPLLIDADGLNAFSGQPLLLKRRKTRHPVLTPHTGELSRLTGLRSDEIERERVSIARRVAKQLGLTLVLKGAPTVTASEDGSVFVNSSGNPGMATAGSGDVLSGIIGALWSQGMERTRASFCGVFIHGKAGDLARDELGEKGMMATDITRHLGAALR